MGLAIVRYRMSCRLFFFLFMTLSCTIFILVSTYALLFLERRFPLSAVSVRKSSPSKGYQIYASQCFSINNRSVGLQDYSQSFKLTSKSIRTEVFSRRVFSEKEQSRDFYIFRAMVLYILSTLITRVAGFNISF